MEGFFIYININNLLLQNGVVPNMNLPFGAVCFRVIADG